MESIPKINLNQFGEAIKELQAIQTNKGDYRIYDVDKAGKIKYIGLTKITENPLATDDATKQQSMAFKAILLTLLHQLGVNTEIRGRFRQIVDDISNKDGEWQKALLDNIAAQVHELQTPKTRVSFIARLQRARKPISQETQTKEFAEKLFAKLTEADRAAKIQMMFKEIQGSPVAPPVTEKASAPKSNPVLEKLFMSIALLLQQKHVPDKPTFDGYDMTIPNLTQRIEPTPTQDQDIERCRQILDKYLAGMNITTNFRIPVLNAFTKFAADADWKTALRKFREIASGETVDLPKELLDGLIEGRRSFLFANKRSSK